MEQIRKIVTVLVFSLFFFLFFFFASQTVKAEEKIGEFKSQITINKDGTVKVEEAIVYDFGKADRHGIFRNLSYIKENIEGKKFKLAFEILSVEDETGRSYSYTKKLTDRELQLKIGDPIRTITGIHTYVIKYKVSGALTYFSDHDELYWNVTGNAWPAPIEKASVEIILPQSVPEEDLGLTCLTGEFGSRESLCTESTDGKKAIFKAQRSLKAYEGLTIALRFPKNMVAVLEPKPAVSFFSTLLGKIVLGLLILFALFWYVGYPFYLSIRWYFYGRDPSTGSGQVRAWYDPPRTKKGRPLTPAETGALVDEVVHIRDILATVVDLARRGYFKIVEKKKADFCFVRLKETNVKDSLVDFEKELLDGIFKKKNEVRLKDAKLQTAVEKGERIIYETLVTEGIFPTNPNRVRSFYIGVAVVAALTLNFPLLVSASIFGRFMPKKTPFGARQANVARSLKNFLTSQERQLEFQAKEQMFFEKLLPFAVAFGVEKVWAKRFSDIDLKPPDWYQGKYAKTFNSAVFVSNLNSSFSSFSKAAGPPTTISSSGFSSGFSSGGGSSGGGGGGGGGGSW